MELISSTLNPADMVKERKREIKAHLLKQPCDFALISHGLAFFAEQCCTELVFEFSCFSHHKCNAIQGALMSNFITLAKTHILYRAGYVLDIKMY